MSEAFARLTADEIARARNAAPLAGNDEYSALMPVPPNAGDLADEAGALTGLRRRPDVVWRYLSASGELLFAVARWDMAEGRKEIRPFCWARDAAGREGWRSMHAPAPRPLYGLDRLAAAKSDAWVIVAEGEKAADAAATLFKEPVVTSAGGSGAAGKADWTPLYGRKVMLWPDNDEPGNRYVMDVARILAPHVEKIRLIDAAALAGIVPNEETRRTPPVGWDAADAVEEGWTAGLIRGVLAQNSAELDLTELQASTLPAEPKGNAEPEPMELPESLLPVEAFDMDLLPSELAPWVSDICDRMSVPPEFVAVPAMVALGSVIGRKVGIRPQAHTDWMETANLWGCVVGRPGAMKSPAMSQALAPLERLERKANEDHESRLAAYALAVEEHKIRKAHGQEEAKKRLKATGGGVADLLNVEQPEEPKARRYIVSDSTYEALGSILADNPNGILSHRDELVSLLKTLDREDSAAARGFYLTAWNGTSGYTFDRIVRGRQRIDAACLSLLGSTQPGRIQEYIGRAVKGGAADDGLVQRFGLLVWPDMSGEWREADRYPDTIARQRANNVFDRLDALDPLAIGAQQEDAASIPFLRFDDEALDAFGEWRTRLEAVLRSGDIHPALESHLAKYRKTVPALALICHLTDKGTGPVGIAATTRALAWADYLESHARRAYGAAMQNDTIPAKLILSRIRRAELPSEFTARDVYRPRWAGLVDPETVKAGLDLLADFDWISTETSMTGGRPKVVYRVNPRAAA